MQQIQHFSKTPEALENQAVDSLKRNAANAAAELEGKFPEWLLLCSPTEWADIQQSAINAWALISQWLFSDVLKDHATRSPEAFQKAWALVCARLGKEIDSTVLWRAITEEWASFQQELRKADFSSGKSFREGLIPWQVAVIPLWICGFGSIYPLAFFTDRAVVQYLHALDKMEMGIDAREVTLDKWRKFRRKHGLKRPRLLMVREVSVAHDSITGAPLGLEVISKLCTSDKRVQGGGES